MKVTFQIQIAMSINVFWQVKKHPVSSYFKFKRKHLHQQKYMSKHSNIYIKKYSDVSYFSRTNFND